MSENETIKVRAGMYVIPPEGVLNDNPQAPFFIAGERYLVNEVDGNYAYVDDARGHDNQLIFISGECSGTRDAFLPEGAKWTFVEDKGVARYIATTEILPRYRERLREYPIGQPYKYLGPGVIKGSAEFMTPLGERSANYLWCEWEFVDAPRQKTPIENKAPTPFDPLRKTGTVLEPDFKLPLLKFWEMPRG